MSFIHINALASVTNTAPVVAKTTDWQGFGSYSLTLDPEAVTAIEPYRGHANADAQEGPVPNFFTVMLSPGQQYFVDTTARDQIIAAKAATV